MSEFSSPQVSSFPNQNILFNSASGLTGQELQKNQLAIQGQQMDLTAADHEQVGRLAAGLLNIQDPTARAQAYAQGVGVLQSQGLAKYAPPTLPDEGSLRMLVSQSIPAADQYKMGLGQQAAQGAITALSPGGAPTTGAAAQPTTGGAGTQGQVAPLATAYGQGGPNNTQVPQDWLPYFQEASQRTGIPADVLIAQMRQESGFNPALTGTSGEIGPAQVMPSTARSPGAGVAPVDPSMLRDPRTAINFQADYLKSRLPAGTSPSDPVALNRALYGYNGGGDKDYVAHVTRYLPAPGGPVQPAATTPAPAAQPGQPQGPAATAQAPPTPASVQPTAAPPAVPHLVTPNGQQVPPPPGGVAVLSNGLTPQQWGLVQNELKAASAGGPAAIAAVLEKVPQLAQQNTALNMAAWKAAHPELGKIETAQGSILYNPNTGETVGTIAHAPVPTTPRGMQSEGAWNPTTKAWEPVTPDNAANAVQGTWTYNNMGRGEFNPAATTPAEGGYKNMETAYKRNSEAIGGIAAEGRTAQADQVRVQEMRNILKTADTGSGTETQAAIQGWMQRWAPQALTNWTTNYANLQGPAAIQMFQKLGFMGATSQEQQTTPRGGYLATKLFQQFNPGAQLLTATNNGLLAQRLISNQAGIDYSQGALNHFTQQEQNFTSSKPSYSSLEQYDQQWQNQRNPQVYAAAIGALGQQDYTQWSKNLSQPEIERTLDVVHRADPSAVVNGQNGRLDLSNKGQPQGQTSAPAVMQSPADAQKLAPGTPYQTPDGRHFVR